MLRLVGVGAAPAARALARHEARAAPGFRPGALRPPARSSLMVSATRRKADQPPEARPGAAKTPPTARREAPRGP